MVINFLGKSHSTEVLWGEVRGPRLRLLELMTEVISLGF